MQHLLDGARTFNEQDAPAYRPLLEKLAKEGQDPRRLFITCADSRINPNLITETAPGELFTVRNIGNIVPPAYAQDTSVGAALEYALGALDVKTIAVCGHSQCGAMKAVLADENLPDMPRVSLWLENARRGRETWEAQSSGLRFAANLPDVEQLAQVNVVAQIENLMTYRSVQKRVFDGELNLMGLYFDIAHAEVQVYLADERRFAKVDGPTEEALLRAAEERHAMAAAAAR